MTRKILNALLVLWVALLPLQTRWIVHEAFVAGGTTEFGTVSIYLTDALLLVAAFLALIVFRDRLFRFTMPARETLIVLFAVVALAGFSIMAATDAGLGMNAWSRMLVAVLALFLIVRAKPPLTALAIAVTASAGAESILALFQFFQQSIPASTLFGMAAHAPADQGVAVVETAWGRFLRPYGTLPHPNMLGGWLALGFLMSAALYLRAKEALERAAALLAVLVIETGLFLTFSRSAFVGVGLAFSTFVVVALIRQRERRHPHWHFGFKKTWPDLSARLLKLVCVSVLLVGFLGMVFRPFLDARTSGDSATERRSVAERVAQWEDVGKLFAKHPLFGVGIGNYTKALYEEVDSGREYWDYQPVHNVVALVAVELGVFGLLLLALLVYVVIATLVRLHRRLWKKEHDPEPPFVVLTSLGLLAFFLIGLFDHYLWSLSFGVMTLFLAFALWARSVEEGNRE